MKIAIVGGTGPHGKGLGHRFAQAGHDVILGSRDAQRAEDAAHAVAGRMPLGARHGEVHGASNVDATRDADLVVVAVPFDGMLESLTDLDVDGRIVVSCVNPLTFAGDGPRAIRVAEGSAAEQIADRHPGAVVVAAFHHVSAVSLQQRDEPLDEHVLVAGDDPASKDIVISLATAVASRGGVDAGPLRSAGALEAMTGVLIHINRRYKAHAGLSVTGVEDAAGT
ncbi:MAG: NADPH-dependent F420 reductase [Nitriliruptoraceae bacterium]